MEIWDGEEQIALATSISNLVEDTTPQLGGDLDCQSYIIQGDVENNLTALELGGSILRWMTDLRLLNVMCENPASGGACYIDISGQGHNGTPTGTWASGDRLKRGHSWVLDPNGTDAYVDLGDHDDFSFGDGTTDSAFTIAMLVQQDATASIRTLISKWDETTGTEDREWKATLTSDHKAKLELFDESEAATQNPFVRSSVLSTGFHFVVFTYSGLGGANADDGLICYIDGVLNSDARSGNQASYTAMEAGASPLLIGAFESTGGVASAFQLGDFGGVMLDAVEMSALDVWKMYQYVLAAYSLNGTSL